MHLLDDSHRDYQVELQIESLRKEIIGYIRELHDLEEDVKDLDIKIALLVKNKITHEVARAQRSRSGAALGKRSVSPGASRDNPFAGGTLDHHTRRKLELYQRLFWHLQTQPRYLARLFAVLPRLSLREKTQKQLEATAFVIFGFAQGSREEYLWLLLLVVCLLYPMFSTCWRLGLISLVPDYYRNACGRNCKISNKASQASQEALSPSCISSHTMGAVRYSATF